VGVRNNPRLDSSESIAVSHIFIALIRLYQRFLSPLLGAHCRFEPSCSHYTLQAIQRHGAIKGSLLGAWRILRCNPLTPGGQVDPVPPVGCWRPSNEVDGRTNDDPAE